MKPRFKLPETGNVSLSKLAGNSNRPGIVPFAPSEIRQMVKAGVFPKPIKLPGKHIAWRVEDIRHLVEKLGGWPG
jgi:hypothetical protein